MHRLHIPEDQAGRSLLPALPGLPEGLCEPVAAAACAARYAGGQVSYTSLMATSGAAFMVRCGSGGFRHIDAVAGRERFLANALGDIGFSRCTMAGVEKQVLQSLRAEVEEGRPCVVVGCFPEAPWRAGLVTGCMEDDLWTVQDCGGRLHSLAPRGQWALLLGPLDAQAAEPSLRSTLDRCLRAWTGDQADEGPQAWRNWIAFLQRSVPEDSQELAAACAAHEFLYESLLDARSCGVSWLDEKAQQADDIIGSWLERVCGLLEEEVELLESRRPPVHHPDVLRAFEDEAWRREVAELLGKAAELDLRARSDLAAALDADYPPPVE